MLVPVRLALALALWALVGCGETEGVDPAPHPEITAESDSGATLRHSFELRRGKTRYAAIEHWTEGGSADLTWQFQRQPMGFG